MQAHARPFRNFPGRWNGCAPAPHAGWTSTLGRAYPTPPTVAARGSADETAGFVEAAGRRKVAPAFRMCDTFANKITLPKTKASRYVALQVWPVHHGTLGGVCCSLRVGERTIGPRPQVKRRCATFHGKEISHSKDFPEVARQPGPCAGPRRRRHQPVTSGS